MARTHNFINADELWSLVSHFFGNTIAPLRFILEKKDEEKNEDAIEKKRDKIGNLQADFVGRLHMIALRAIAIGLVEDARKVEFLRDDFARAEITSEECLETISAKYKKTVPNPNTMRDAIASLK